MREILFRGKRIDNGAWVEAFSCVKVDFDGEWHYFIGSSQPAAMNIDGCGNIVASTSLGECQFYAVVSDTLGQFTGLTDKNGTKIFEGDILALRTRRPHIVKFEDGGFVLTDTAIPISHADKFDVIGNIHDNPELLEV